MEWFLTTARLGFRAWHTDDLPLAARLWGDERFSTLLGGPFTAEQIRARLDCHIEMLASAKMQYWPMFLLDGGEFVGCAGLRPHDKGPRIFEIGYHLVPEFWGRGLATEAGRAVVEYGFAKLGAEALFAGHHPDNRDSARVLLKLGFEYAGHEVYPPTGWVEPTYWLRRRF